MDESHFVLSSEDCLEILEADYQRLRSNLKNILETVRYCGICLATHNQDCFYMLDFTAAIDGENVSLEQMFCDVFGDQITNNIVSKYICNECSVEVKKFYMLRCKVKNNSLILNRFIEQIDQQVEEVSLLTKSPKCDIANVIIGVQGFDHFGVQKEDVKEEIFMDTDSGPTCDYCQKEFKKKVGLKKHISTFHMGLKRKAKMFSTRCPECQTYPCIHERYLESLKEQRLGGNQVLQCIDCEYRGVKVVHIITHVNKEHLNVFPYLCETCGSSFPSKYSHTAHMKKFHLVERFICPYCDRKFGSENVLEFHSEQCQKAKRKYACNSCPASFNSKQSLELHILKKHQSNFECNMCSKCFPSHPLLLRHKSTVHIILTKPPKKPHQGDRICTICQAKFTTLTKLKDHLATHGPNEKHKCQVCDRSFDSRKTYLAHTRSYPHMRRLNPNLTCTFSCTDCSESFPSSKMLENHRNVVHLKIKPYGCETCGKTFTTATHLKHHLQIHEGVKNFQCTHCSIMLSTLSSLKKHVLRHHSEKKPFACVMCDRSFVCKSERVMHTLKAHSDVKVPCPVCEGKFRHRSNVKSHIYKVHLRDKDLTELLEEHKDNEELMELMRDRRKPFVEN